MNRLIVIFAVLIPLAGASFAKPPEERILVAPRDGGPAPGRGNLVWYDDLETGAPGWTHGDVSGDAPKFHIDTYMAYVALGRQDNHSWWCGEFDLPGDANADGGYANSWDQRLDIPPVDWTGYTQPVISFAYRNATEPDFDHSYVEAKLAGDFVGLNSGGYDGVHAWSTDDYSLVGLDNPAVCRFRVVSDGAWSDEDGLYDSAGGAFACDEITVFDNLTSTVLFYDDVEAGGLCTPTVAPVSGDFWVLGNNKCQAYSGTRVWQVTSPDTTTVPPNLQNWLQTPVIDMTDHQPVVICTLFTRLQLFMPVTQGGYWKEEATVDGGATWVQVGLWQGDQCGSFGPCHHYRYHIDLTPLLPGNQVAVRWTMYTDALGNSADPGCPYLSAGITIDDTWVEVTPGASPIESSSWGRIKSLYR